MSNQRLINLHKADPHCHWCKRLTVMPIQGANGKAFDHMATVDHLHSRLSGKKTSGWFAPGEVSRPQTVLACFKCNNRRAEQEHVALGPDGCKAHSDRVWCDRNAALVLGRQLVGEHRVYAI